jgi:tetratricopeptide (TPR) repeat protein
MILRSVLLLVFVGCIAHAQSLETAQSLYAKGAFLEAYNVALALNTSAGFAFAARNLDHVAGDQRGAKREALYVECEKLARKAIALDAKNADGYFELGAAVGQLGNARGAAYAFANGVATQVRDNFERALQLNPRHILALGALGRWHAEIVSRGVGFLFGGDAGKVTALFERAIAADPKSIFARLGYARALLVLDAKANRNKARDLLETAVNLTPRDFVEGQLWDAAGRELVKLR